MSSHQEIDDPVLCRVRDKRPSIPAETLSPGGAEAQRILARVTRAPSSAEPSAAPRRRRAFAALAGALVIATALTVALLLTGGGDPSIVAQAYAATSPQGAIVRYVERSYTASPSGKRSEIATDDYWLSGLRAREAFLAPDGSISQDIVTRPGRLENLSDLGGLSLLIEPLSSIRCSAAITLEGYCQNGQTPMAGLRALMHSGALRATGQTTVAGQKVAIVTGNSGALTVRALIDVQTALPVRVTLTDALPAPRGTEPYVTHSTITGYRRLPATAGNRALLNLPAHPNAHVIRFRTCPISQRPNRLCRASR